MFGITVNNDDAIIQSLEYQGFKRLYSSKDIDRKKELRKLNHSVLVNFLDLIDILIKCPESPKRDEKIEDINLLFIHMHHLINEFRPHQARETLRVMLMVQKRRGTSCRNLSTPTPLNPPPPRLPTIASIARRPHCCYATCSCP